MKIIKYGHIKGIEIFCNGCGATLEYSKYRDIRRLNNMVRYVECPVCGKGLVIDDDDDDDDDDD